MDLYQEALARFRNVLQKAHETDVPEPTAMTVATADVHGRPSVRSILLKGVDEDGFVFYTNIQSRKGRALTDNPWAALCFFWQPLMEQVEVEGSAHGVTEHEADTYWMTRDRQSQLGAWASRQSQRLDSRRVLELRVAEYARRFSGRPIPRPPHWSGYRVVPRRMEFWTARPFRLHERVCYEMTPEGWSRYLLNP